MRYLYFGFITVKGLTNTFISFIFGLSHDSFAILAHSVYVPCISDRNLIQTNLRLQINYFHTLESTSCAQISCSCFDLIDYYMILI